MPDRVSQLGGRGREPRRNRAVAASVTFLALLTALSAAALPFASDWHDVQSLDRAVRHPPSFQPVVSPEVFDRAERRPGEARSEERAPHGLKNIAFHLTSLLGHDDLGRSLMFRLLPAYLISAGIGLAAAGIAMVVGVLWGMTAGLIGGRTDLIMMRVVDVLYGLPYILMVILLRVGLTPPLSTLFHGNSPIANVVVLFVAIGSVSWLTMARVVRGQVLSLKESGFVESARVSGASTWRILRRHVLPNLVATSLTYALLVVPQAILQESFLSYLGIGIQQPTPSLGRLAADGVEAVNTFVGFWWLLVFPCGLLVITLLALNIVGDALREWFDPKSRAATLL